MSDVQIIELPVERWQEYRELRLRALQEYPEAYAMYFDEENMMSDEEWQDRVRERVMFFAELDEQIVGMVGAYRENRRKYHHIANICNVYVSPQHQGQGIGLQLLKKMLLELEKLPDVTKAVLSVTETQKVAQKMYEKLGFRTVGTFEKQLNVDNTFYNEIYMEKILK
jgi:ribosomal protein S18 acetylase RimI-like enzyme